MYDIYCSSARGSILGGEPLEVFFCIRIENNGYSLYYNVDYSNYPKEFIYNVENIFSEKVNTMYEEYTDVIYTDEHKNKLHYFFEYLMARMEL